jgi:hypothetical protein
MHPALQSWRDELPSSFVRILAYLGAVALLSIAAARVSQPPARMNSIPPAHRPEWVAIERPFPAFALSIPEAADVPANYAIRRHVEGGGRKDVLMLGDPDSATPFLQVEIYRPGNEIHRFPDPKVEIVASAGALGPVDLQRGDKPLTSKFGELTIVTFAASKGVPRRCLGFARTYRDPRLQISGWFCQGGAELIEQGTLARCSHRPNSIAAIAASATQSSPQRRNTICSGKHSQTGRSLGAEGDERRCCVHHRQNPIR